MRDKPFWALILLAGHAALSGCGADPATQPPVKFQPGRYEVSQSGAVHTTFPQTTAPTLEKSVCVTEDQAEGFPRSFPRKHYSKLSPTCGGPLTERVGNRITGKVVCPFPELPGGDLTYSFEGEVAEQSVNVRAKMVVNLPKDWEGKFPDGADPSVMEELEFRLNLRRTGDC